MHVSFSIQYVSNPGRPRHTWVREITQECHLQVSDLWTADRDRVLCWLGRGYNNDSISNRGPFDARSTAYQSSL